MCVYRAEFIGIVAMPMSQFSVAPHPLVQTATKIVGSPAILTSITDNQASRHHVLAKSKRARASVAT